MNVETKVGRQFTKPLQMKIPFLGKDFYPMRITSVSMCKERKIILKSEKCVSNMKYKVCIHIDGNLISCQIVVSFNCSSPFKSHCKMGSEASPHTVIWIL